MRPSHCVSVKPQSENIITKSKTWDCKFHLLHFQFELPKDFKQIGYTSTLYASCRDATRYSVCLCVALVEGHFCAIFIRHCRTLPGPDMDSSSEMEREMK